MLENKKGGPEVVTYKILRIDPYQVTRDELDRIEERCGRVGQDLTFSAGLTPAAIPS
jgi:hypothetical protein